MQKMGSLTVLPEEVTEVSDVEWSRDKTGSGESSIRLQSACSARSTAFLSCLCHVNACRSTHLHRLSLPVSRTRSVSRLLHAK